MTSPDQMRALLKRLPGLNFDEIYHVTTFRCYRRTPSNEMQVVIVEIQDLGPEHPDIRYTCTAISEDKRFATGNPASSIEGALAIVHWGDLEASQSRGMDVLSMIANG
jgi:hypothetical protein